MTNDRHTYAGLAALLLWSVTVALARRISESVGPLTAGAAVYLAGGLILTCHLVLKEGEVRKLRRLPRAYLFGCGSLFLVYTVALFPALGLAQNRHQAIEVGLLNYLWPMLTMVFSLFILGRKASGWLIPGTLIALVGVFLVLTPDSSISWRSFSGNVRANPIVYGLGLVAAVSWALYSNLTRRWGGSNDGGAVPLFVLLTGVALLAIRLLHPEPAAWSFRVAAEVTFLAVATALAYVFWDIAMRKGDTVLVVACSYLTPFLSTVASCVYLGVLPGPKLWIGCGLLVVGSFISWRSVAARP